MVAHRKLKGKRYMILFDRANINKVGRITFHDNIVLGDIARNIPNENSGRCPMKLPKIGMLYFCVVGNNK